MSEEKEANELMEKYKNSLTSEDLKWGNMKIESLMDGIDEDQISMMCAINRTFISEEYFEIIDIIKEWQKDHPCSTFFSTNFNCDFCVDYNNNRHMFQQTLKMLNLMIIKHLNARNEEYNEKEALILNIQSIGKGLAVIEKELFYMKKKYRDLVKVMTIKGGII
jgi:hypothetical protein